MKWAQKTRALDVACGDGNVTKDILKSKFDYVDMIDHSSDAGHEAKTLAQSSKKTISF